MDIYEYAMQLEKDGEKFYRDVASKTDNKGLRTILTMLADAEVKHYKLFENMKANDKVRVSDSPILNDVKNVFIDMREKKEFKTDVTQIGLYKKAQEIEIKTRDLYLDRAKEGDADQREIFLKIAGEEKRHYLILENIIRLVSQPDIWLENPEWYHLEDF
ncbi:MAG TPA: ferritin family protein [Candidatus Sulfobium mesophilum]|nr:ferritin family protein [Candidatus Sulfobium mesophilum]